MHLNLINSMHLKEILRKEETICFSLAIVSGLEIGKDFTNVFKISLKGKVGIKQVLEWVSQLEVVFQDQRSPCPMAWQHGTVLCSWRIVETDKCGSTCPHAH